MEHNGKNICENILKLKLKENIKYLVYNHLVYICAEDAQVSDSFMISLWDKTEDSLWHSSHLRFIIESV